VEYQETLYPSGYQVEALCCSIAIISVAQGEKEVLGVAEHLQQTGEAQDWAPSPPLSLVVVGKFRHGNS